MKKIAVLCLFFPLFAFAAERPAPSPEQFQKLKERVLANHKKRIEILQDGQNCIQAATSIEDLKTCRRKEVEAHNRLRGEMRGGGR